MEEEGYGPWEETNQEIGLMGALVQIQISHKHWPYSHQACCLPTLHACFNMQPSSRWQKRADLCVNNSSNPTWPQQAHFRGAGKHNRTTTDPLQNCFSLSFSSF